MRAAAVLLSVCHAAAQSAPNWSVALRDAPALIGAKFYQQWLTLGGTACPLGLEFSNALHVELQ